MRAGKAEEEASGRDSGRGGASARRDPDCGEPEVCEAEGGDPGTDGAGKDWEFSDNPCGQG